MGILSLDAQKKKDFLWESIKKINCDDVDLGDYGDRWYLIENDRQLKILKNAAGFYDKYNDIIVSGDWKIGGWITWQFDDGGIIEEQIIVIHFLMLKMKLINF